MVQVTTEWVHSSAWLDRSGTAQASVDMDANRLVLLDTFGELRYRIENGDSEDTTE